MAQSDSSVPTNRRITSLDTVRGFAVLGILLMNVVSFSLPLGAYFRIDGPGTDSGLDWAVAVAGEILVDQKFMALFSLLFGAGIALFADRAHDRGRDAVRLSLWRNALLLAIGLAHALLWDGDVLRIYALCSPIVVALRGAPSRLLVRLGVALVLVPTAVALLVQTTIDADGTQLGEYWLLPGELADGPGLFLLLDYGCRALGMMLLGIVLHRNGFLAGRASVALYRRVAVIGLAVGWTFAAVGVIWLVVADFAPSVALIGQIPNTFGTIPAALGYAAALVLWDRAATAAPAGGLQATLHRQLQAVGRMALTNYLAHTLLMVLVFLPLLRAADVTLTRTVLAGCVLVIWALQLAWSPPWLERFRWGPAEWLWRSATYRSLLSARRT